jgi:Tol biopolymer transport system component
VKFGNPADGGDPGRPTTPRRRMGAAFLAPLIAVIGLLGVTVGSVYAISLFNTTGPAAGATNIPGASGAPDVTPRVGPDKTPNPTLIVTPPPAERPTFVGTILFARAGDIWAANGSSLTRLTTKGSDSAPAWSPDGEKIYFIQTTQRATDPPWGGSHYTFYSPSIMSMNVDGSNRHQLYSGLFKSGSGNWFSTILTPDVSPDGKTIAVVSDGKFVPDNTNIQDYGPVVLYTIPASGNGPLQDMKVRNSNGLGHNDPAWSPDGTQLAFTFNGKDGAVGAPKIGILTLATRQLTLLKKGYANPSWSPDMRYIAAERTQGNGPDIVVLDPASGAEVARLTSDGNSFNPVFSPNGDQIAYLKRNGLSVDLRVMTLDLTSGITLSSDKPITADGGLTADSAPAWFIPVADRTTPPAGSSPGASAAPPESTTPSTAP